MVHASLFSGIGAADLAATWMGWENAFSCEVDPFCDQVLAYHFPDTRHYGDIKTTDFSEWRGRVDVLTGGFPCQPFSMAGKRRGTGDDRYLWPEMLRVIREVRPAWIVGENVAGLATMVEQGGDVTVASGSDMFGEGDCVREARRDRYVLDRIIEDLGREGYTVQPFVIPACAVGAPHRRDRIWIIAHGDAADTRRAGLAAEGSQQQAAGIARDGAQDLPQRRWEAFPSESPVCRGHDGFRSLLHLGTILDRGGMSAIYRTNMIMTLLNEGRIVTEPETGKIFSTRIRGHEGEKIELKGCDCNGYIVHSLKYKSIGVQARAHQIIWMSVNGLYDKSKLMIDHINRDRKDNRISNLRLVTPAGNCANQERKPRGMFGIDDKIEMYVLNRIDGVRMIDIASMYGCSDSLVNNIVHEIAAKLPDNGATLSLPYGQWRKQAIKAYGNSMVPQVVYEIFRAIQMAEDGYGE